MKNKNEILNFWLQHWARLERDNDNNRDNYGDNDKNKAGKL